MTVSYSDRLYAFQLHLLNYVSGKTHFSPEEREQIEATITEECRYLLRTAPGEKIGPLKGEDQSPTGAL